MNALFFSLLLFYPFSLSFSFSFSSLFKRRVVTWQDNVLPGHNGGWKREFTPSNRRFILEKREMERFVSFEFVNSFLVIISKRIIEIFIIDFWWNLDWNIFQILRFLFKEDRSNISFPLNGNTSSSKLYIYTRLNTGLIIARHEERNLSARFPEFASY